MAVAKVLGLETEYGITSDVAGDYNPVAAPSLLIASYLKTVRQGQSPDWDFRDESPDSDIRVDGVDDLPETSTATVETQLLNVVLTNGARYYVDHAHPEISTPECTNAYSAVLYDRASELIAIESMNAVQELAGDEIEIVVYKNNSDGKGNSYGCHENYLVDRATPFSRIVRYATAHLVTRQIFTGAGKVGAESPGSRLDFDGFQLTQRADFIEEEVGLETTLKRPIINTRDEPHADPRKYRRLHVILGDANLAQVATFLKFGTTAIVLAMVEDNVINSELEFMYPVESLRKVSRDLTLRQPLLLKNGSTTTALAVQWYFLTEARAYVEQRGVDSVGGEIAYEVLNRWEEILSGLERDPMGLAKQIDWVAKLRLFKGYRERYRLSWNDVRLRAMDIQYHDLRPERSLAAKLDLETLVSDADAKTAVSDPPPDTRAFFRGRCLQHFPSDVVAANWDSIVFDMGSGSLRRVTMMEPLYGTSTHVGSLFGVCQSAVELVRSLKMQPRITGVHESC